MEALKKQERLAFLEETVNFYNLNNRGFSQEKGCCVYIDETTGNKCAIGRHLPDEVCKKFEELGNLSASNDLVFFSLPESLRNLGLVFLKYIQNLHDQETYWTETGISEVGLRRIEEIKKQFIS